MVQTQYSNTKKHSDVDLEREITDDFHLGHVILETLRKRRPNDICQLDAITGVEESFGSFLRRSVRLARAFRASGLRPGDVITISGQNNINIRLPYIAALYNGLCTAGIDPSFKYTEIKSMLEFAQPKVSFCEEEKYDTYMRIVEELRLNIKVITYNEGVLPLEKFIEAHDNGEPIESFQAATFNGEKVFAFLPGTSGTSGSLKLVGIKHKDAFESVKLSVAIGTCGMYIEGQQKTHFLLSPPQWISAYLLPLGAILTNTTIVQSSVALTTELIIEIIKKYKISSLIASPNVLSLLLKSGLPYDLKSLDKITIGGANIHEDLVKNLKAAMRKDAAVIPAYGATEQAGLSIVAQHDTPVGSCGKPQRIVKLVDPDSGKEITEPYKNGELYVKGPMLTEYYNNPEETANAITADGWLRTGDLMYRDDDHNYYYVERLKMLIKYYGSSIFPVELESVILQLPDVLETAVTSVPHPTDGEWPVAFVVRRPGSALTAQTVKQIIAERLSDAKQLRGGVIFTDVIPKTSTGKPARALVKEMANSGKYQRE